MSLLYDALNTDFDRKVVLLHLIIDPGLKAGGNKYNKLKNKIMSGGDWKAMFKGIQENDFELVSYYLRIGIDPNYQHPEYMALPLIEEVIDV